MSHPIRTSISALLLMAALTSPALADSPKKPGAGTDVISAGGGNVITPGGGNVITPGGGNRQLKQNFGAGAPPPATRRMVPADLNVRLDIHEHRLSNGLRLLMLEDHKAPVVTFQVWYQVGSKDERPGLTGVSHFLEHLMFQGAKKYGTGEFDKVLTRNGGQNNAFTTEDYTAFYEVFASDRLPLAFDLESDRMQGLLLPPDKVVSEKNVVKEERRWRTENSPTGAVWEDLMALSFEAHPYHWPVIGWMSDLDAMSRDQILAYYRTYYRPDNAIVVVVGDFDTATAIRLAEKYYGRLPAQGGNFPRNPTVEPPQNGERRAELIKNVQSPVVMAAYHVPAAGNTDLYALDLLDTILSSGESSRLYHELVYKQRVAQQVGSGLSENKDPGIYYVYGQPMPGKSTAALERPCTPRSPACRPSR